MKKRYTFRQRLVGFGTALLVLLLLGACGKSASPAVTNGTTAAGLKDTAAINEDAMPVDSAVPAEAPGSAVEEDGFSVSGRTEFLYEGSADEPAYYDAEPGYDEGDVPYPADDLEVGSVDPAAPMPDPAEEAPDAEPYVLTAAEWNDNANWPFFTNLVNAGTVSFPVFGIDPTHRITVTLTDEAGSPLANEPVTLLDAEGGVLWQALTGRTGVVYLFYQAGQTPDSVIGGGSQASLTVTTPDPNGQGNPTVSQAAEISLTGTASAAPRSGLQVMFIVDSTGSMSDELSYLQKDFSSIAQAVGSEGVSYSVCFYRDEGDEYVTKCTEFTSDVPLVQSRINAEYAEGGGDTPEAVAEILTETLVENAGWDENAVKIAFLIYDAPPHVGRDAELDAAIRSAAARGIHVIPVVASNADRETELFGRALAICTDGTYVFLTDDSGVGGSHLEPIVGSYSVEKLHDLIVRLIESYR